jgi:hypothetical protein
MSGGVSKLSILCRDVFPPRGGSAANVPLPCCELGVCPFLHFAAIPNRFIARITVKSGVAALAIRWNSKQSADSAEEAAFRQGDANDRPAYAVHPFLHPSPDTLYGYSVFVRGRPQPRRNLVNRSTVKLTTISVSNAYSISLRTQLRTRDANFLCEAVSLINRKFCVFEDHNALFFEYFADDEIKTEVGHWSSLPSFNSALRLVRVAEVS